MTPSTLRSSAAPVDTFEFRIETCQQETDENSIEKHRRFDDQVKLFVSQI